MRQSIVKMSNNTGLSELEKQRQAFIDQNKALLKKLNIDKGQLNPPSFPSPQAPKSKKRAAPKPKQESTEDAPLTRRKSSRLQGLAADSEVAKRKADDLHEAAREAEQAKRRRRMDSFTQDDMFVSGQKLSGESLIATDVLTKGVAVANQRTFGEDDIKKTTDKELKALREEMNGLNLWDEWETQVRITPERLYTMAFHPSEARPLIFGGDKMGNVGIIDGSQKKPKIEDDEDEDESEPVVTTLKPHARTISSMTVHPSKPTSLYTASYDSSIRELDLEKTVSVEKWGPEDVEIDDGISGLDMAPEDTNTLYWTTLSGSFNSYDMRSPKNKTSTWELSEKKIGGFSLCPSDPNFLATASLDRTIKLWDIRQLSKKEPVPVAEHTSRLSVSHAAFNAAGQVVTSSYDDTLKIYDFGSSKLSSIAEIELRPDPIVRHNCQVGRWVTILRPNWQINPQSNIQRFCIGNMNRFVDIYSANGDQLAQLGGPGITAVPAVAIFHRSKNWVAGGNASGKICLWQ